MTLIEQAVFVLLFGLILLVAYRARNAVRTLWQTMEELKARSYATEWKIARDIGHLWGVVAPSLGPESPKFEFTSQAGEDFQAWRLLNFSRTGFYVDIGAFDGVTLSNTFVFEQIGWKGVLVEASSDAVQLCRINRPNCHIVHAAAGPKSAAGQIDFSIVKGDPGEEMLSHVAVGSGASLGGHRHVRTEAVPYCSLDSILEEIHPERNVIDLISIDVEGAEFDVIRGLTLERWKPRVLIVESNDVAVLEFLRTQGFRLEMTVGCNWILSRS